MLPVVVIEWNDAVLRNDLNDTSVIWHKPLKLHSVGYLLQSDKDGVTFSTDYDPNGKTYREQSFIPRSIIVSEKVWNPTPLKKSVKTKRITSR